MTLRPLSTLLFLAILSACGSTSSPDAGTTSDAGGGDTGTGSGACNEVVNIASLVSKSANPAATPPFTGGAVVPGTYLKTAIIDYGTSTPGSTQHRETWVISATTLTTASQSPGEPEKHNTAGYLASGSTFTLNLTCPQVATLSAQYTATPTEIRFMSSAGEVHVYTLASAITGSDGGTPDGSSRDGGGGGPQLETIATGLTDLVDLDLDGTDVYVLGGGNVKRCALGGCGANATQVVSAFASSLAVNQGTLFLGTNYREISSCSLGGTCTLSTFLDVGANTYPTALLVANDRLYWISESGPARRIQVCPIAGCTAGYPKFVYQGALLDGVPISGFVMTATDVFITSFTGGVFRIPLTGFETSNAAAGAKIATSDYGTGGLDLDGTILRWVNVVSPRLESCTAPGCAAVVPQAVSGLVNPQGMRHNATHVYGINRGTSNGSGGFVAQTATLWRYAR